MSNGCIFQPTRPLRGATTAPHLRMGSINFNPRAPCGARPRYGRKRPAGSVFQPTRPLRGATTSTLCATGWITISTHAPLAGRDIVSVLIVARKKDFNPRAPCGARRLREVEDAKGVKTFQPTRPLRGATINGLELSDVEKFQPTRPLRGATFIAWLLSGVALYFNPRAPCGARRSSMPFHTV